MSLRCIPVIPVAEIQILVVLSSNEKKLTIRFACESTATLSPHSVYIRVYQVYLYLDQELNYSKSYICLRGKMVCYLKYDQILLKPFGPDFSHRLPHTLTWEAKWFNFQAPYILYIYIYIQDRRTAPPQSGLFIYLVNKYII